MEKSKLTPDWRFLHEGFGFFDESFVVPDVKSGFLWVFNDERGEFEMKSPKRQRSFGKNPTRKTPIDSKANWHGSRS